VPASPSFGAAWSNDSAGPVQGTFASTAALGTTAADGRQPLRPRDGWSGTQPTTGLQTPMRPTVNERSTHEGGWLWSVRGASTFQVSGPPCLCTRGDQCHRKWGRAVMQASHCGLQAQVR
jgi:hypothetical protein